MFCKSGPCSPPKLLDDLHQNFTRYSGISGHERVNAVSGWGFLVSVTAVAVIINCGAVCGLRIVFSSTRHLRHVSASLAVNEGRWGS